MKDRDPVITGGIEIPNFRDQQEVTRILREHVKKAIDWEYHTFCDQANTWADIFRDRFFDGVARLGRDRLPDPVIGVEPMRISTLAAYTLIRNAQGLLYNINFNEKHFIDGPEVNGRRNKIWKYGEWAWREVECHEEGHLWQQNFGDNPYEIGVSTLTHNREYVLKMESIGLHPALGDGHHLRIADGDFERLMREYFIPKPDLSDQPEIDFDWWRWFFTHSGGKERTGQSTIKKWVCPGCHEIWYATKKEPKSIICKECGLEYVAAAMLGLT